MYAPQRHRRNRDPYAESFRERHALKISAAKRWAKRILFVVLLYALYLLVTLPLGRDRRHLDGTGAGGSPRS